MTVANNQQGQSSAVSRQQASSLADVVDLILEKGLVIDAFVRVSLVGIELITIDARVVVASVDTYLRFAEATNRLDLHEKGGKDLPELVEGVTEGGSEGKTKGMIEAAKDKVDEFRDDSREREQEPAARPKRRAQRKEREE
ncbi:gas vesicle protein GvpJ [Saccharopolyspora mangrovi]|uniref:Gas vesicle protein A n=1 Tax=Saccharopolyspora mangrovi TaxID=3082379 RepID=A0ABU6ACS0_9PSEU|nr:gas vesicle protein GvpJ [Saccharopolyspora sp. S2-29]MEB3369194.1 gas vesicle protein GvpJ [Saccharopolyspora sp. S2-29]